MKKVLSGIIAISVLLSLASCAGEKHSSYITSKEILAAWDKEAENNPTGFTHGIKIDKKEKEDKNYVDVDMDSSTLVRFSRDGADIREINYYLYDNTEVDYMALAEGLLGLASDSLPAEKANEAVANFGEYLSEFEESGKLLEGIDKLIIHFNTVLVSGKDSVRAEIRIGYSYDMNLIKSDSNLGLSFNYTLDEFIERYNQICEETYNDSLTLLISGGDLNKNDFSLAKTWPNGIQHMVYTHGLGVNKWSISVLVYDGYVIGGEFSTEYHDDTKQNQIAPQTITFRALLNESEDRVRRRYSSLYNKCQTVQENQIPFIYSEGIAAWIGQTNTGVENIYFVAATKDAAKKMEEYRNPLNLFEEREAILPETNGANETPVTTMPQEEAVNEANRIADEILLGETDGYAVSLNNILDDMLPAAHFEFELAADSSWVMVTYVGPYRLAPNKDYTKYGQLQLCFSFADGTCEICSESSDSIFSANFFEQYAQAMLDAQRTGFPETDHYGDGNFAEDGVYDTAPTEAIEGSLQPQQSYVPEPPVLTVGYCPSTVDYDTEWLTILGHISRYEGKSVVLTLDGEDMWYNVNNGSFEIQTPLIEGKNTFVLKTENSMGEADEKIITVTRKGSPQGQME